MIGHVTETPDRHFLASIGENETLTGKETDHLENLHHETGHGLKIMIIFPHDLNHPSIVVEGPHHHHEEWMTVLMVDMMITTCARDTGMSPLPENHTQETHLITEVNHLTEIGGILMILLGVHTLKEEMTGMIALIHMEGKAVMVVVITLILVSIQVLLRGQEWSMMVQMIFTAAAARVLRRQQTVS